ncbi:MAG: HAD family hydrolase [Flavobacteriaceae bacterium]|jgi:phosphoglycolate phosphatase-like HAD superfamily hydrolase|nr:HAD family hydrolase [Flavobacteriaceae bacterium]MBT6448364.1 HAD family hydrolase [Flavobacteriaceae bacterium]
MKYLSDFKNIIWDFDGVIIDSSEIRVFAFRQMLNDYPPNMVDKLIDFHKKNDGLSRYVKIDYFFSNIINQSLDNQKRNNLLKEYGAICSKKLDDKQLLIKETIKFITSNCNYKNFHIASGSDNNELNNLCLSLDIISFFNSINGSPEAKKDIVKRIIIENQYINKETCLIGDSINDYDAAIFNQIQFFGFNNKKLKKEKKGIYLDNIS